MAEAKSKADVLRKTREMLAVAQDGLRTLSDEDDLVRKKAGIYNLAVFGRSVTLVLQNMRTIDRHGFNQWYQPYESQMSSDPLFHFFNKLRTEILKEGLTEPTAVSTIYLQGHYDPDQPKDWKPSYHPSETLPGYFEGATSWVVKVTKAEDGSFSEEYIPDFTPTRTGFTIYLPAPPISHLGRPLAQEVSLDELGRMYLQYLEGMVLKAEYRFGGLEPSVG